jgi:hypothetical protein
MDPGLAALRAAPRDDNHGFGLARLAAHHNHGVIPGRARRKPRASPETIAPVAVVGSAPAKPHLKLALRSMDPGLAARSGAAPG